MFQENGALFPLLIMVIKGFKSFAISKIIYFYWPWYKDFWTISADFAILTDSKHRVHYVLHSWEFCIPLHKDTDIDTFANICLQQKPIKNRTLFVQIKVKCIFSYPEQQGHWLWIVVTFQMKAISTLILSKWTQVPIWWTNYWRAGVHYFVKQSYENLKSLSESFFWHLPFDSYKNNIRANIEFPWIFKGQNFFRLCK